MNPAQQAERYRMGDLLLQDAIMDYCGVDTRDAKAKETLLSNWHDAQNILEGGRVQAKPNTAPGTGDNTSQTQTQTQITDTHKGVTSVTTPTAARTGKVTPAAASPRT